MSFSRRLRLDIIADTQFEEIAMLNMVHFYKKHKLSTFCMCSIAWGEIGSQCVVCHTIYYTQYHIDSLID